MYLISNSFWHLSYFQAANDFKKYRISIQFENIEAVKVSKKYWSISIQYPYFLVNIIVHKYRLHHSQNFHLQP